ncbi:Baseplate protein J-like [uncultured Caudovirales phage]|uniref:Baseplate protein J-like n=1 Tax=uncultured Caudovirales phage TaxID=2100421 RepID=A0A6J5KUV1_9CAUD|nr:Baseplate protein J-like [uncultured Caudovirales phage]
MANVNINSYNEILGAMIRKIIADTPANDLNKGSVILTLLEAAAANDFENNTAILNVLELLNIDALRNNDLDAYASNFGLIRRTATKASGFVTISDSSITKRSTTLYPVKPAPIIGTSTLYVNDASTWNQTGIVYIGRGTTKFEGPIAYTSIINNGTFYTINLSSTLEKDHLLSDVVVDGQGTTDRFVTAGTTVKIPANNISPEIKYMTLRDAIIPAGEDSITGVPVTSISAGSVGNAGINTITLFNTPPFATALITNTNSFTNGTDTESDDVFRNRIKAYSSTLARGTKKSILASIDGVSDETEGKQVASAVITEPANIGQPSIVYVDDGTGFEPSFSGQSVDLLVASASGHEEFLQLANYPLPRPQAVNNAEAPFLLTDGMELKVLVDSIEEAVTFTAKDFRSLSTATISEVVVAINNKATLFKARLTVNSTRILLYPVNYKSEKIQVVSDSGLLDANTQFKFSVNEFSYIALYKNNVRLREVQKSAAVTSNTFTVWSITTTGNIILSVDGTPDQDRSFDVSDFGGKNFNALVISDWVTAFNTKFAGITATASTTGRLIITSNREGSVSQIEITGGSYLEKMFGGQVILSIGQDSDFALNRQNGNLQLANPTAAGDVISAGSSNTKGSVVSGSASGGNFNVSTDANSRPAEVVIVVDANIVEPRVINLAVGSSIVLSNQGSNVMRIMASTASAFKNVQPNDYIYIANRGDINNIGTGTWIDTKSCGLFKVYSRGEHTTDSVDTYLEVINVDMVVGGPYSVQDGSDFQAFFSDKYPQLWKGTMTAIPAAATIQSVVNSINSNIRGASAKTFRTNYIKISSVTEDGGSIAIPVSIGNASTQLFSTAGILKTGTASHIANKVEETDVFTIFKRTTPTATNVWLDRHTYTDMKGSLTSAVEPSKDGSGAYSETLTNTSANFSTDISYDDAITITSGQNKEQIRNIKSVIDNNNVGTRNSIARTLLDYNIADEYQVIKNLEFSAEDNLVAIIDNDAVAKTIDISFSRTGQVNTGSQSGTFTPTNLAFSANDADNEAGIDFGTLSVWGTLATQSSTNFADYAVWFKARNWYAANGASLMLRCKEYGPIGDKVKFNIDYPSVPNSTSSVFHTNSPSSTKVTYTFGSGPVDITNVSPGDRFTVTDLGSYNFRMTFPVTATVANITIGDVISISNDSGFSIVNTGVFRVNAKSDVNRTIDIYNPAGIATVVGNPAIHSVSCLADVADSLDGTYFTLNAPNGDTIKFWYDNNNSGTVEPDIGTTTRSWEINVATGASAITVATATAAAILNDTAFNTATNGGGTLNLITVTNSNNGPSLQGVDGSLVTNFSFSLITGGIADTYESLNVISGMLVFSLTDTATAAIASAITAGQILEVVEVTAGNITKATREESAVVTNELSYGHDANPLSFLNEEISFYDSLSYVLTFQNANPNFQLKTPLVLNNVSPVYSINTTINVDSSVGEKFRLVPITIDNINHQLTQKALSQLNIVSDIDIASSGKKIQLKSQLLGSNGAIEVVGGRANEALFKIIGDSQISIDGGVNYLEMKIPASPNALSPGQHVILQNDHGVERLNRQIGTDSMDVIKIDDSTFEYRYNNKNTYLNQYVKFAIVDANSIDSVSYPTPGLVWRWTHSDDGIVISLADRFAGTVLAQPGSHDAVGTLGSGTNIIVNVNDIGTVSTTLKFDMIITGQPVQADYITFRTSNSDTFAVNFQIDGNTTAPTGTSYTSATHKVAVAILSTDTSNEIMSKIYSSLLTNNMPIYFSSNITAGANLFEVREGNLVNAIGNLTGWDNTNKSLNTGDSIVSGYPIVKVNATNKYFDVVNPRGVAMASTPISASSTVIISSTPVIEWKLAHSSRVKITSVSVTSFVATATTSGPHRLNVGDTFSTVDIVVGGEPSVPGTGVGTVTAILGLNQFTYVTAAADSTSLEPGGFLIKSGLSRTRYKIESLGYNSLFRLKSVSGDLPMFKSCGVAIDDILSINGTTFSTINSGEFSVMAVDEDSIIYRNINAVEELNTIIPFNNFGTSVNWVSNSNLLTGTAGSFANLSVGDWVKKQTDDNTYYKQVVALDASPALATIVTLGSNYSGVTSTSIGILFDQNSSVNTGMFLQDETDIKFYEGDSVKTGDILFITENNNANWFETANSGSFAINAWGTNATDGKIFLRITNLAGVAETNALQNIANTKFSITEAFENKFSTIKQISHVAIDQFNPNRRIVYLSPGDRAYKWGQSNVSSISALGKMNYNNDIVTGVDGYLYYTGLLRKVQRIIDGFEPDATNFPGRKAVGSLIEVLPPLPRRVTIAIDVTTQDGVNLSEISNEITSAIINYVSGLGVGEDVILSDITVRVKNIDGVAAVTFITPEPTNERIAISSDEKAFIENSDISIA